MKIGIFGDSFCDHEVGENSSKWWHQLGNYGHEVQSFGESGASLVYSAEQIEKNYKNFDFLIWAVTEPTRMTILVDEEPRVLHFTKPEPTRYSSYKFKSENNLKIKIATDFHKHIFDDQQSILIGQALVYHLLQKHQNLMVIPCFYDPLNHLEFNLYTLNLWEAEFYFPNTDLLDVYRLYRDNRPCHLSIENNQILAKLVADDLKPGIFQTEYSNFKQPSDPAELYWTRR